MIPPPDGQQSSVTLPKSTDGHTGLAGTQGVDLTGRESSAQLKFPILSLRLRRLEQDGSSLMQRIHGGHFRGISRQSRGQQQGSVVLLAVGAFADTATPRDIQRQDGFLPQGKFAGARVVSRPVSPPIRDVVQQDRPVFHATTKHNLIVQLHHGHAGHHSVSIAAAGMVMFRIGGNDSDSLLGPQILDHDRFMLRCGNGQQLRMVMTGDRCTKRVAERLVGLDDFLGTQIVKGDRSLGITRLKQNSAVIHASCRQARSTSCFGHHGMMSLLRVKIPQQRCPFTLLTGHQPSVLQNVMICGSLLLCVPTRTYLVVVVVV
jgi:hypothetical protein